MTLNDFSDKEQNVSYAKSIQGFIYPIHSTAIHLKESYTLEVSSERHYYALS